MQHMLSLQERIEDFENFTSMIAQTLDFDAIQNREFVVKPEYDETLQGMYPLFFLT